MSILDEDALVLVAAEPGRFRFGVGAEKLGDNERTKGLRKMIFTTVLQVSL